MIIYLIMFIRYKFDHVFIIIFEYNLIDNG